MHVKIVLLSSIHSEALRLMDQQVGIPFPNHTLLVKTSNY